EAPGAAAGARGRVGRSPGRCLAAPAGPAHLPDMRTLPLAAAALVAAFPAAAQQASGFVQTERGRVELGAGGAFFGSARAVPAPPPFDSAAPRPVRAEGGATAHGDAGPRPAAASAPPISASSSARPASTWTIPSPSSTASPDRAVTTPPRSSRRTASPP